MGRQPPEYAFARYTTAEGLSHNIITGIAQDKTGYIWLSTLSGLNRYNGSGFVQPNNSTDSFSRAIEELNGMGWLDQYHLGIYTTGLYIIDTRNGHSRTLLIPWKEKQFQYKFNKIIGTLGDDKGNIYILGRSGFYQYDSSDRLVFRFDYYEQKDVPVEHFYFGRGLFELDKNRLLITSIGGMYIYDKTKRAIKKAETADCALLAAFINLPTVPVSYQFFQRQAGSLFILDTEKNELTYADIIHNKKTVTRLPFPKREFYYSSKLFPINDTLYYITGHMSGFYAMKFDPRKGQATIHPQKYFPSYHCNAILKDKDNNLWIATNKGLLREDPGKEEVQQIPVPLHLENSFPNIALDDIAVAGGNIYAGTRGFGGLLVFNKKDGRFLRRLSFEKFRSTSNNIYALSVADSNTLLIGADGPLISFDRNTEKGKVLTPPAWETSHWTSAMYKDREGQVWISSSNVYRYHPQQKTFYLISKHELRKNNLVVPSTLCEDAEGKMWMGGHGLSRYNSSLDSFDHLLDSFPHIQLQDKQVTTLVIDEQNTAWFSSRNNGLIAYDTKTKKFDHYTIRDGLPDNNIVALIIIGNKLWIATRSGIACMDMSSRRITSFGVEDGFPDMPIVNGANFYYDSSAQQLYCGFSRTIARFNPGHLLRSRQPPHLFIEELLINGEKNDSPPGQPIDVSWRNNEIRLTIGSINFLYGKSQRFAYRIIGKQDTGWRELGTQSFFTISNLAPGNYRIQVKSFSVNNRWPKQIKEISITVPAPFYQHTWFLALGVALLSALFYGFTRWRTNIASKKEREKTDVQKLKAEDYKNRFELEQISNYFSSSMADKTTEEEVLWDVVNNLIARMDYVDCMIYLWNDDKTKMVQKAAYGLKGSPASIEKDVFDVSAGQGVVGHVMSTRQPVLIPDTRKDSRYRVDEMFRLSEICVPIIHNDELLGVVDSEHPDLNYYTERDLKILTTIATLLGNKLKQIRSEQSLKVKQEELASINEQLSEARLSALQAQMNPHFVFNALNSIKRMILDKNNTKASKYLSKFALMIRMTLRHSKHSFVTLTETITYMKAYLEMEQLRFNASFSFDIETDDQIDDTDIQFPSLMIQPLAENAIWHGLMYIEGEKKITIGFRQENNKIICTIRDNGIGIIESERLKKIHRPLHQSMGLENLQNRIKIMNEKYDMDCTLDIIDLQQTGGRGTLAEISLNIINI